MAGESPLLDNIDVILHRPQASENIGSVARAMKNFGLSRLVLVAPQRYDTGRAEKLAKHSVEILHEARHVDSLDEAIAPYALVIPTTERQPPGRSGPLTPRESARMLCQRATSARVALLFGEEATGLTTALIARFPFYASIPTSPERKSLNLAQAVLLFAWELFQESGNAVFAPPADGPRETDVPVTGAMLNLLRERTKEVFLPTGFLNPQDPDRVLDELIRLLQRAHPTQRETEMLLAGLAQITRLTRPH